MVKKSFPLTDKKIVLFCLLIISVFFIYHYTQVFDYKPDMNGDNIYYYSLGKALAEGEGFSNTMSFEKTPHTHFPPGYPLFIAGIMKIFPDSIEAIKIANGILLYFSILLLFFLLKKITGNFIIPLISCVFCTVQAEILDFATMMMSEMLYLFLTIVVLYLLSYLEYPAFTRWKKIKQIGCISILVFCFNYIYFVRTMGTSLILAVLLYYGVLAFRSFIGWYKVRKSTPSSVTKEKKNKLFGILFIWLLLTLSFLVCKTAWDIRDRSVGKAGSNYTSNFLKKTDGQTMSGWNDWSVRLKNNTTDYITRWMPASIFQTDPYNHNKATSGDWVKGLLCLGLMLVGLIKLKKLGLLLFFYLGATFGVLLLYPEQFGGFRYMIAVIPFLIFLFLYGLTQSLYSIGARFFKKNRPFNQYAIVTACFAALAIFPLSLKALVPQKQMAKYKTWNARCAGIPFAEYLTAIEWCKNNLPDTARVICRKPELFYLYSGGRKASGFPQFGKPEEIYQYLVSCKATHVIIDHWFRHAFVTLYPLISTHYPENFKFLCQVGGGEGQTKEPPTLIFEFNPQWGYQGELEKGKRQGKGKLVFPDGRTFVGHFENNRIQGYGELYDSKGNLISKGIWANDTLVKKQ